MSCGPDQADLPFLGAAHWVRRAALRRPGGDADAAAVADEIVKDLFAVALTMCSALPYTDDVGSLRIRLAVAQLDGIIAVIRPLLIAGAEGHSAHRVSDATRSGPPTGAAG